MKPKREANPAGRAPRARRSAGGRAARRAAAPLCVLGMHRSGTSLVTGLLRLWGLDLGPEERMMEPRPDNPRGFGEHLDFYALNEELLARLGGGWDEPVGLTTGWVRSPEIEPLRRRARALVRRDFGHGRAWAWKDPRTSLLLPFWKSVLPGMRFVICVRHPDEVAASLRRRNRLPRPRSLRLWVLYTAAALHHTRGAERMLVFPDRLLRRDAAELTRLRRFAGVPARRAAGARREVARFASPGLWHHRAPQPGALAATDLPPDARLLHAALLRQPAPRARGGRAVDADLDLLAELIWTGLGDAEELARQRGEAEAVQARLAAAEGEAARLDEARASAERRAESLEAALERARREHETALAAAREADRARGERIAAVEQDLARERRQGEVERGRLSETEARLRAEQSQRARSETRAADLERRAAEAEGRAAQLESRAAEAESRAAELESRVAELEALLGGAETRAADVARALDERDRRSRELEEELVRLAAHADALDRALREMRSTLGWRALERYRRARDRILARSRRLDGLYRAISARLRRGAGPAPESVPEGGGRSEAQPPPASSTPEAAVTPSVPVPLEWKGDPQRPPVVIAIPHWNRREYLEDCLGSVFEHTGYPHYAVCVVDQASTDGSREYLASLGARVHVIALPSNVGFVHACNLAVEAFPEWDVVFLNNDTWVTAGWLEALVATATASPEVGLVGARLVYPDGRLQEAGSQLFRDGRARAWGRLERPGDLRYEQRREVDYCSAAALLVKREVLDRCGAFDERYAPSYYEDADLALKARAAGYRTLYEPASTVIHREYGSSDPNAARERMERNRRLFVERWSQVLAPKPVSLWQAPSRGRQAVLYVGDIVPAPDRSAGGARLFQLLTILARECDVSYAFLPDHPVDEYLGALERAGVHVYRRGHARAIGDESLDLEAILVANRFSPVICALHTVAAPLLPLIRKVSPWSAIAVDTYDVHYLREEREARVAGRAEIAEAARRTREAELAVYARADEVVTVTEADREALVAERPQLSVSVIPTVHPVPDRIAPRRSRSDLLFVGGFSHRPNVDAALFLCREVLPAARARLPALRLHLVGKAPPAEVLALRREGVDVHGYVADLRYFLDSCLVSIAPLRFGSGMKGEVGDAMAHGLPVVTTPIGALGMDLTHGREVLVADTAAGLAEAVVRLHEDPLLWETIAQSALTRVRSRWSPEAVAPELIRLVRRLAADR